jgi:hypothetical protein
MLNAYIQITGFALYGIVRTKTSELYRSVSKPRTANPWNQIWQCLYYSEVDSETLDTIAFVWTFLVTSVN